MTLSEMCNSNCKQFSVSRKERSNCEIVGLVVLCKYTVFVRLKYTINAHVARCEIIAVLAMLQCKNLDPARHRLTNTSTNALKFITKTVTWKVEHVRLSTICHVPVSNWLIQFLDWKSPVIYHFIWRTERMNVQMPVFVWTKQVGLQQVEEAGEGRNLL